MSKPSSSLLLAVALAALVLIDRTGPWERDLNANELSRLQAAAAMALRGTPEVSVEVRSLGHHQDLAARDGQTYSNKAPGLALLWVPLVRLLALAFGPPAPGNVHVYLYLLRVMTVTLPWLWAAQPMARIARRLGGSEQSAAVIHLALTFASPVGLYAGVGFSHVLSAVLLVLVVDRLLAVEPDAAPRPAAWLEAGAAASLAATSEYPAAVPAAVLLAIALHRECTARNAALLGLGAAVFVLPFLLYNAACFGGALRLSSGFESDTAIRDMASAGLFGVGVPRPTVAAALLFGLRRGLLGIAPWMAVSAWGYVLLLRSGATRRLAAPLLLAALALLLVIAGYSNWHGGWGTGPRYLVPVLPLLALGLSPILPAGTAPGGRTAAALFLLLAGVGIAFVTLASLTFVHIPETFPFPPVMQLDLLRRTQYLTTLTSTLTGTPFPWLQAAGGLAAGAALALLAGASRALHALLVLAGIALGTGTVTYLVFG